MSGYNDVKNWRKRTKARMAESMGGKCVCCGYNKHITALEFHHIDPQNKSFSFGRYNVCRWDDIVIELRKCVLVCANCHREIEAGVLEVPQNCVSFDESYSELAEKPKAKHDERKCCREECGKAYIPSGPTQKYCSMLCSIENRRRVKFRPSKESLKKMLETSSYQAIGRKYGVSGVAVKKWLK